MSLKNHVEEKMKLHEPGSKEHDHYRLWLAELERGEVVATSKTSLHVAKDSVCESCE